MADLAAQQLREEVLLVGRSASEQVTKPRHPSGRRAGPAQTRDALERRVDIGERQAGGRRRWRRARIADRREAHADPPLGQRAAQVCDGDLDVGRRRAGEERGQPVNLVEPPGCRAHAV